jgi:hypothetical protein
LTGNQAVQMQAVHPHLRGVDRQPGGADGAGRSRGDLCFGLAGGGRHE